MYHATKRCFDAVISLLALVILALPMLCIAVLVKLTSPGPAIFRQRRVGVNGKEFCILKFRTMVQNAEALGSTNTVRDDPRITPLGRFLRKAKLDELPQFVNVLLGHMSLVGPRPMPPEDVARYTERQREVLRAKPGITGASQLQFADEEDILAQQTDPDQYFYEVLHPAKLELELKYVASRSAWGDLKLLLATPVALFRRCR